MASGTSLPVQNINSYIKINTHRKIFNKFQFYEAVCQHSGIFTVTMQGSCLINMATLLKKFLSAVTVIMHVRFYFSLCVPWVKIWTAIQSVDSIYVRYNNLFFTVPFSISIHTKVLGVVCVSVLPSC